MTPPAKESNNNWIRFRGAAHRVGAKPTKVQSVKAADLLAVPTAHWLAAREHTGNIAEFLLDFQHLVGGGAFPWRMSPYPVSAGIYVGLRWRLAVESPDKTAWDRTELDRLFKPFFWRNALLGRYDQGFLTKLGTDLKQLLAVLQLRPQFDSLNDWLAHTAVFLDDYLGVLPTAEQLVDDVLDGRTTGARARAISLPLRMRVSADLLNPDIKLEYPSSRNDLHHIFPKKWCLDNSTGALGKALSQAGEKDLIGSVANLLPLSSESNNKWRSKNPALVIEHEGITFKERQKLLTAAFIDQKGFSMLKGGVNTVADFWKHRARLIVEDLLERMSISGAEEQL